MRSNNVVANAGRQRLRVSVSVSVMDALVKHINNVHSSGGQEHPLAAPTIDPKHLDKRSMGCGAGHAKRAGYTNHSIMERVLIQLIEHPLKHMPALGWTWELSVLDQSCGPRQRM